MAAFVIPSIYTAIDKFSRPIQKMRNNVQKFAQRAEAGFARADRALRRLTPSIGKVGKQFLQFASAAAISAAIIGGVTFSVKALQDYESSLASLQAITGVSNQVFGQFKGQISSVATETKRSAVEIAGAFEIVGSAKPELLANAAALGEVTKNAVILSKATKEDLSVSAQSLTGILNQFNLEATDSNRIINALAAGSQAGAAAVPLISQAIDKFGTAAASMNVSVEESIGLVETLAFKQIKGAEAGTNLRNILLKLAIAKSLPAEAIKQLERAGVNTDIVSNNSLKLSVRLRELSKIQNNATALAKVFGTENLIAGQIILQNVDMVDSFTKAVTGSNTAIEQAAINSDTFSNRLDELGNAWVNLITKNESATGTLGAFKNLLVFAADNLETIVRWTGIFVGSLIALKTTIFIGTAFLKLYNIALGVSVAIQRRSTVALIGNQLAIRAFEIATKAVTAVQWLWNAAMSANPIGLVIIAVSGLIALIGLVITNWDEWGDSIKASLGPLGQAIGLIESLVKNWTDLITAFEGGGFDAAVKVVGRSILDVAEKDPAFQNVDKAAFSNARAELERQIAVDKEANKIDPVNVGASTEQARIDRVESTETSNVNVRITDETGRAVIDEGDALKRVTLVPSFLGPKI